MTTTDEVAAPDGAPDVDEVVPAPRRRRAVRPELLLSLELVALAAFAFSRPVLDMFGRSPETFIARDVRGWGIVAFGATVALVPAVVVTAVGVVARRLGRWARRWAQPALVGVLGGVAVWRLGQEVTGWPGDATKLVLAGLLAGILLAVARLRLPATGTFLRVAGASSLVYPLLFLFASPVTELVLPSEDTAAGAARGVTAQLGDDPPNVLFVVFDELPLTSLLDGTGHIDGELYPNFADLAAESTWYRNNTTVAGWTQDAVPALMTGRYPSGKSDVLTDNLFSLLGDSYEVQAHEQVTRLCPNWVCPVRSSGPSSGQLGPLLGEAVDEWLAGAGDQQEALPHIDGTMFNYEDARDWVDGLDFTPVARPRLTFTHVLVPHSPWRVLGDGTQYAGTSPPLGLDSGVWTEGTEVGRQRHVLQVQAGDDLLGRQLQALREAGTYDDTLVIVTADHGISLVPGTPPRALAEDNLEHIVWTPLLVKLPGQTEGSIDDSDVRSIDVVPTIADVLGVEVPWDVDGEPIGTATDRDGRTKPFDDHGWHKIHADEGESLIELDTRSVLDRVLAADPVPWTGPDAVWKRTEHGDLFGHRVDDLAVEAAGEGSVAVDDLDRIEELGPFQAPYIELVGRTSLPEGTCVAYALNGTIAAVTEVVPATGDEGALAQALVPPAMLAQGHNELTAYVATGPVGSEVLTPLDVVRP
jgi:hypothetical protein